MELYECFEAYANYISLHLLLSATHGEANDSAHAPVYGSSVISRIILTGWFGCVREIER